MQMISNSLIRPSQHLEIEHFDGILSCEFAVMVLFPRAYTVISYGISIVLFTSSGM